MNKKQFNQMIEGLNTPSRIKLAVNKDYDFLLSAKNTNDTVAWFKYNSIRLEKNLRKLGLKWVYVIETCPKDCPFIYMIISPTITQEKALMLMDSARRTLPDGRSMIFTENIFQSIEIDKYDYRHNTIIDLLTEHCSDVIDVSEI